MLKIYHEAGCTTLVDADHPISIKSAAVAGANFTSDIELYMKSDDATVTYESITIGSSTDVDGTVVPGEVDLLFATHGPGTFGQTYSPANGAYGTVLHFHMRVFSPAMGVSIKTTSIVPEITYTEFKV